MRFRHANFLAERHGRPLYHYEDVTPPPPPGVKLDANALASVIQAAVPGLRVREDGRGFVHGFVTTVGLSDGSLFYSVGLYPFGCEDLDCAAGHAGEMECADPDCPLLPEALRAGRRELLDAVVRPNPNPPPDLMALVAPGTVPFPLALIGPRHAHKRVVRFVAVPPLRAHDIAAIEAAVGSHPEYRLLPDEAHNQRVIRSWGVTEDGPFAPFLAAGLPWPEEARRALLPVAAWH